MTGVVVERDGDDTSAYSGDIVVRLLRCGEHRRAAPRARRATRHPTGLANGSDHVGRNYMFDANQVVLALSREPNPTGLQKTLALNDFYFGTDDYDYPLGGIQMVGKSQTSDVPRRDAGLVDAGSRPTGRWRPSRTTRSTSGSATEDLPLPENRVTLDRDGELTLALDATNNVSKLKRSEKLKSMLGSCDMEPNHLLRTASSTCTRRSRRQACPPGRARAASGPIRRRRRSNVNCRAHELDNLYVVDTSFFSRSAR